MEMNCYIEDNESNQFETQFLGKLVNYLQIKKMISEWGWGKLSKLNTLDGNSIYYCLHQ